MWSKHSSPRTSTRRAFRKTTKTLEHALPLRQILAHISPMARRAAPSTPRGRGRPAKDTAPPAVVAEAPKRRGRAPKAAAPVEAEPQPKKRGRAAKAPVEDVAEEPQKRVGRGRGRPRKEPAVEDAPAPAPASATPKRGGRPRKQEVVEEVPATPKRRGRPPKSAVDLHRVAGSPRVSKRTSPRANPTKTVAPATRLNPIIRSKLRSRALPAEKKAPAVAEAPKPKRRVGRPPKQEAAAAPNTKKARVSKPAEKPSVPRKRRGITTIEIADKFAQRVKDFVNALLADDAAAEASEATPAQSHVEEEEEAAPVDEDSIAVGDGVDGSNEMGALTDGQIEAYEAQDLGEMEELEQDIGDITETEKGPAAIAQESVQATSSDDDDQGDSSIDGRTEGVTADVVIRQEVEIEVEIDEAFDEPQESAIEELQLQQQSTDETSERPDQPADELHSLFDETNDGSFVSQALAAATVPVTQLMSPAKMKPSTLFS